LNIRIKTLLLANVSLISFLLGIAIGIRQPILQRFALLERNLMQKRLANVGETFIQQVEKLDSSAKAEAIWTEMYNYISNPNSKFYRQTYTFEGLSTSSLDVLGIFNIKGKSIHLDLVDRESRQLKPLANAIATDLRREQQLLRFPDDNDPALARSRNLVVLQTRDKPLIVAVRPILTVNAEGPRQGTLLMGSFINHEFLALLEKHNNLKLNLAPVALEQPDIELVNIANTRENRANSQTIIKISPHTRILDNDWIVGEIYLLNSDRQPVQILQVKAPRLEYQQGETTLNQLTGVLFAIGIFLGIVISLLLDKSIRNQQLLKISETFLRLANQELQQLADRDGLTQIPNRRCFERYLCDRWELATEEQLPFTLIQHLRQL
jgi:sensor domain CHASE-containing protein